MGWKGGVRVGVASEGGWWRVGWGWVVGTWVGVGQGGGMRCEVGLLGVGGGFGWWMAFVGVGNGQQSKPEMVVNLSFFLFRGFSVPTKLYR